MSTRSASTLLGLVAGAALILGACDDKAETKDETKEQEPAGPTVKVQLPPSPNFDEGKAPEKYDGDVFSLWGLRSKLDENVKDGDNGKEILVRGHVQEIYLAPECPEGEVCPPPKQAHVWITDHPEQKGKKRAMMVVNYRFVIPEHDAARWKDQPEVILEKGKQYTFKGRFKRFSNTGFAFDRGLLEFVAYKPHDPETGQELNQWVFPPGAEWHPLEVQRMEEENAQLAEKAKASVTKPKPKG